MKLRIDYDHDALSIMDAVNEALAEHGLEFVNDEEEHDGYEIYNLVEIEIEDQDEEDDEDEDDEDE